MAALIATVLGLLCVAPPHAAVKATKIDVHGVGPLGVRLEDFPGKPRAIEKRRKALTKRGLSEADWHGFDACVVSKKPPRVILLQTIDGVVVRAMARYRDRSPVIKARRRFKKWCGLRKNTRGVNEGCRRVGENLVRVAVDLRATPESSVIDAQLFEPYWYLSSRQVDAVVSLAIRFGITSDAMSYHETTLADSVFAQLYKRHYRRFAMINGQPKRLKPASQEIVRGHLKIGTVFHLNQMIIAQILGPDECLVQFGSYLDGQLWPHRVGRLRIVGFDTTGRIDNTGVQDADLTLYVTGTWSYSSQSGIRTIHSTFVCKPGLDKDQFERAMRDRMASGEKPYKLRNWDP